MSSAPFSRNTKLREILQHPLGSDVVDKIMLYTAAPSWLPSLLGGLRLGAIDRLATPLGGKGLVDALIQMCNDIDTTPSHVGPDEHPWWRSAVFYQIYPRSFSDANGDGIGDIRGIIQRLDYLNDLGVDCLWLSPIFASPNRDMGYDVSDYRAIMSEMGTLADVDELIEACHARGMRIIADLVVNHTSSDHAWFQQALEDPNGPYGDYYFFVDGEPDVPPNNWQSFFSGSAWRWVPERQQWVLHLFDEHQVDLNWDNPAVRDEVADIVRWWLDRGLDGFRMDVINYISKRDGFPNGHPLVSDLLEFAGIEHYLYGKHLDEYLAGLRRDGFTRPDGSTAVMIGETPGVGIQTGRLLSGWARNELDLVFNFDVLETPGHMRWDDYVYDLNYLARFWSDYNARIGEGDWVSLFVENHDNPRIVSKICPEAEHQPQLRARIAKLVATMQLTMRGTPFIFQGQELGKVNEPFTAPSDLRDVESLNRYSAQINKGREREDVWREIVAGSRDHARTPMRWSETQDDSNAWLPGHEREQGFSAEAQRNDPDSVWQHYRTLLSLRKEHAALATGRLEVLHHAKDVFSYVRRDDESSWLIELNLGPKRRRRPKMQGLIQPVIGTRDAVMEPWSATVSRLGER